jgi:hypothetical protein
LKECTNIKRQEAILGRSGYALLQGKPAYLYALPQSCNARASDWRIESQDISDSKQAEQELQASQG